MKKKIKGVEQQQIYSCLRMCMMSEEKERERERNLSEQCKLLDAKVTRGGESIKSKIDGG